MSRGRAGVISKEYKGEENTEFHDIIKLFKIYRVVNWQMQIKINQVKRRFHTEYGTDVDSFLDSIYQAGMDVDTDLASEKERVMAISRSNQYLICPLSSRQVKYLKVSDKNTYISFWSVGIFMHTISLYIF